MVTYTCPRCIAVLEMASINQLRLYHCKECDGHALQLSQLRKSIPADRFKAFWHTVRQSSGRGAPCPGCRQSMTIVQFDGVEVDICHPCQFLWIDAGERDQLAGPTTVQAAPLPTSPAPTSPTPASSLLSGPLGADLPPGRYCADMRGGDGFLKAISNAFQSRRTIRDESGAPIGKYEAFNSRRHRSRYVLWYSRDLPHPRQLTIPMPQLGLLGHATRAELRCGFEAVIDIQIKSVLSREMLISHSSGTFRLVSKRSLSHRLCLKEGRRTAAEVGHTSGSPFLEHEVVTHVPLAPELVLVLFPLFSGLDLSSG